MLMSELRAWISEVLAETDDIQITPLEGATTSTVMAVDTARGAYAVRLYTDEAWLAEHPDLPEREFDTLSALEPLPIATPIPVALSSERLSNPALLMMRLPGAVELPRKPDTGWLDELARQLAAIHAHAPLLAAEYTSWNHVPADSPAPAWFPDPGLWRSAMAATGQQPPGGPRVLLHRDYHPVNLLWQDGRICGVVDWINACSGPASVDLGHCRVNLALMYQPAAADRFLTAYRSHRGEDPHDTYYDLDALLAWFPQPARYPPWTEYGLPGISDRVVRDRAVAFMRHLHP